MKGKFLGFEITWLNLLGLAIGAVAALLLIREARADPLASSPAAQPFEVPGVFAAHDRWPGGFRGFGDKQAGGDDECHEMHHLAPDGDHDCEDPVAVPEPVLVWPLPTTIVLAMMSTVPLVKSSVPDEELPLTLCGELSPIFSVETRLEVTPRK